MQIDAEGFYNPVTEFLFNFIFSNPPDGSCSGREIITNMRMVLLHFTFLGIFAGRKNGVSLT